MKRILLLVSLLFAANAYSQVLWSDDFESYELGDFLDQGGWMRDGGEDDCVQVVNLDEAYGKSLQMNTTEENYSGIFVTHFNGWSGRDPENNILTANFDFFTGQPMDGLGLIVVGTENYNIIIEVGWFQEENMLYIASQDDEAVLLEDPEPDSWYHFSLSYDMLSGEITGRVDDGISCTLAGTPGMVPEVFDFSSLMESQIAIDNVIIEAIFNNHIGLFEGTAHTDETIVSPNPASNFLQLEHSKTPAEALVYDLNGKLLEKHTHTKRIPIHSLNAGVYLLEIKFKEGVSEWVKFVKE